MTDARSLDAEVVVIGAGVMGAATAWQLARRGVDVVLVERFSIGHKHGASHGASRNFNVSYEDERHLGWLREAQLSGGSSRRVELGGRGRGRDRGGDRGILTTTGIVNHGPGRDFARVAAAVSAGGFDTELLDAAEASSRWPGLRFEGRCCTPPKPDG